MNQSEIEHIHNEITPVLELYINGLITDWELAIKMREIANRMDTQYSTQVSGLNLSQIVL